MQLSVIIYDRVHDSVFFLPSYGISFIVFCLVAYQFRLDISGNFEQIVCQIL